MNECMNECTYTCMCVCVYEDCETARHQTEKGPYRAKTKLKLRVDTPVRVNLVKKSCSITKNYLFPIFSPNLKSNSYRESA